MKIRPRVLEAFGHIQPLKRTAICTCVDLGRTNS